MQQFSKGRGALILLSGVQAALRLFFAASMTGVLGADLQQQVMGMVEGHVADWTMIMTLPFLLLGALGAVSTAAFASRRTWGDNGIMLISAATMAYDLWAALAVQPSAVIGLVLPVASIVYMVRSRRAVRALPEAGQ